MVGVHQTVGTLVVLAYVALTVVNILRLTGKNIPWARPLSFGAAGLLVVQFILGFSLLGDDHKITFWHYAFALLAILTVGAEHGMSSNQKTPSDSARIATVATAGTALLTIIAYAIGSSN